MWGDQPPEAPETGCRVSLVELRKREGDAWAPWGVGTQRGTLRRTCAKGHSSLPVLGLFCTRTSQDLEWSYVLFLF